MFTSPATMRLLLATLASVVLVTGCGQKTESTGDAESPQPQTVATTGLELYTTYCQGCHGPEGRGDGPVAPLLTTKPSDLTGLVSKYGEFPEELVSTTIDGRAQVEGHGSREMPVWGNVWTDPTDPVSEERIRTQINTLVEFIRAIQADSVGM